jgi:hypothetical protein
MDGKIHFEFVPPSRQPNELAPLVGVRAVALGLQEGEPEISSLTWNGQTPLIEWMDSAEGALTQEVDNTPDIICDVMPKKELDSNQPEYRRIGPEELDLYRGVNSIMSHTGQGEYTIVVVAESLTEAQTSGRVQIALWGEGYEVFYSLVVVATSLYNNRVDKGDDPQTAKEAVLEKVYELAIQDRNEAGAKAEPQTTFTAPISTRLPTRERARKVRGWPIQPDPDE